MDASRSMLYGEGATNKLEYAKTLTAVLAYLVVHQRDAVALNVFDAGWQQRLPASSQVGQLQTLFTTLESVEPRDKNALGPLLHDLANTVRRRGIVFVISDCFDEVSQLLDGMQHLRFDGHEVIVFHILHPDEVEFPFGGMVKFDAMEDPRHVLTRPQQIRPGYLKALAHYLDELRLGCERNRCDYVLMNTGRPLQEALTEYLARRLRVRLN
jgi:uncharacterized protein (DUF58 family)